MPRGGARPGAGRKPKIAAPVQAAPAPAGFAPDGVKVPEAPRAWPFGTETAPESTLESEEQPVSNLAPLDYLLQVMRGETGADEKTRLQAAALAAPFVHVKAVDRSKKADTADAAQKAASGRFAAPVTPPRLVVSR
jgi:hypothetical protein